MTSLLCQKCQGSVYVEGYPAGVPYLCPYCRGAMPPRAPSPVEADLREQLAAITAERDRAIADRSHLADGLAHALGMDAGHPLPCSMLASVRIVVAAADAVREERDRLAADLTALREAVRLLVDALEDRAPSGCHECKAIATQYGRNDDVPIYALSRCDAHADGLRNPGDFSYAPAWRRLVAMVRPPEPDPEPAPGTVAWFDKARADLAAEGTPVDAADWLIGPDED